MLFYRCKCGAASAYGSMPPDQCAKCDDCGSNLATSPDTHRDPLEHDFTLVTNVATDQGPATVTRCRFCKLTAAEIEQRKQMP